MKVLFLLLAIIIIIITMPSKGAKSRVAYNKKRNERGFAPPSPSSRQVQVEEVSIYGDHSKQFEEFADSLAEDHDSMDCGMSDEACEDYELFDGDLHDSDNEFEVNKDSLMRIEKEIEAQEMLKKRKQEQEQWSKIICVDGKIDEESKGTRMKHTGQRGDSRRSNQRHNKAHADLEKAGEKNNNSLDKCWGCEATKCSNITIDYCVDIKKDVEEDLESRVNKKSPYRTRDTDPKVGYQKAIDFLNANGAKIVKNKREEVRRNKTTSSYQHVQYIAVARYLQLLLEDKGKMEASDEVARMLFAEKFSKGKHKSTKQSYISRSIRNWADNILDEGCIKESRQGKHIRILNVLTSKEVQTRLIAHLQNTPMVKR